MNKLNCKSCGSEIDETSYETFEGMHWLCFHLAFEHTTDPDEPCESRLCPIWHLQILKEHLEKSGQDVDEIINNAVEKHWQKSKNT
jgi:hypothetical protein